jgi:flagellar biosynthetic protein FliQ
MSSFEALDLAKNAIQLVLIMTAPIVISVMLVGIVVAMLQTLTQVQEMTLTFVPKIIIALLATSASASFIGSKVAVFSGEVYSRIGNVAEIHDGVSSKSMKNRMSLDQIE